MNVTILRLSCAPSVSLVVIEEKSFRPPVVGTPAYLATRGGGVLPEVCAAVKGMVFRQFTLE